MDIALVSTPFVRVPPEGYGGTELVVSVLAQGLAARGHRVTLWATGDSVAPGRVRALYPHAVWPPDPWRELAHACAALRAIEREGPFDVVHAHTPAAAALVDVCSVPMAVTIHHAPEPALGDVYRAADTRSYTPVALTHAHARALGPDLWEGDPVVVGHGLPPARFPLGPGGPRVGFLGRWCPEKGPHAAILAAREAGVGLRLAGRAHEVDAAWWAREGEPLLAAGGVDVVGEVHQHEKAGFLGGLAALLFPIGWEEPFGLVMIEAMLCGTPVVALDRGSVPEVIDEGVTGFIVSDLDAMARRARILADGGFDRARCRAHAVRRHAAGTMVGAYEDLYRRLVRARAVRRVPAEAT
jgi:glycosyltransferase involved in cell wall biosynthesis